MKNMKIFALVGLYYSQPYQDQSKQDFIVWDLDTQTIQNKTIVNESENTFYIFLCYLVFSGSFIPG